MYVTWDAENSMVLAWLVNAMDEDIISNYICSLTTKGTSGQYQLDVL